MACKIGSRKSIVVFLYPFFGFNIRICSKREAWPKLADSDSNAEDKGSKEEHGVRFLKHS